MDADNITIRPFTSADAAVVAEIYNETIAAGDASMDRNPKQAADILRWQAGFNERECLLVLEIDGEASGWGIIKRYSERQAYSVACETAVYLRRALRRRGLGTYLKRHIIEKCRELGYHHLVAKIFANNEASIRYNMRLGYELVGIQREIGWLDGHWQDVAILQLVLGDVPPDAAHHP
ncbi:N-acetyltransferase [bacterium]|nr:N-acetyltransferase [bacterium]